MNGLLLPVSLATLLEAFFMSLGFFAAQFLGALVLPGFVRQGFPTPTGERKTYKLTGLTLFLATQAAVAIGTLGLGWSLTPILTHFWSLLIVVNALAVVATGLLYWKGRASGGPEVKPDVPPPSLLHDLWLGNQLNPTLWGVDIKMFFYQPSLIGLFLIVVAFAYRQFELYHGLTIQMILFVGFWWAYLFTHYVRESFMLSTWDIIAENFGFMLVWGDLVYVPFFYSICGWFLIDYRDAWPISAIVALLLAHALGHYLFRSSNWQKDRYRRDPSAKIWGRPPDAVGGKLLASGFWGIGRKLNYTGEVIVYVTFALCTGFQSPIPYVLPLSLFILLAQRALRDDRRCREKYGDLWSAYCRRAKFRMIPFIY